MTKVPEPSWDTRSKNLTEDEVVASLTAIPLPRLLRALRGFPPILEEIAKSESTTGPDEIDMMWLTDRLRLFFLVLEQRCGESDETEGDND